MLPSENPLLSVLHAIISKGLHETSPVRFFSPSLRND